MKKSLSKFILPLLTLALFTACEDVPAPYYVLKPGEAEITLEGDGTYDSPYTVASALTIINAGTYTSDKVYVKGIVSSIDEIGGSYGNATYFIADALDENGSPVGEDLEVYRGYGLGGDKFKSADELQVGDTVVVYGQITLYGSTPEITQGSILCYLNGATFSAEPTGEATGSGTKEDPYNSVAALKLANSLGANIQSDKIYIKGKVVSVKEQYSTQYGNATFYISDDGTTNGQFYVFRALYLGNKKYQSGTLLEAGDDVIVCGKITNYQGNTPETVQGEAFLYSLNGEVVDPGEDNPVSGDPKGSGTKDDPYNVAKALNLISTKTYTSDKVYVKGKISSVGVMKNGELTDLPGNTYGNATYFISDDGSTTGELEVYRGYGLGGAKFTSSDDIKVGDEVIVYGELTLFYSTAEITQGSEIYSLNGKTAGGGEEPQPSGEATGDGTLENPYNSVAANEVASKLGKGEESDDVYIKGKVVSIKEQYGTQYGNATFYISDDGTTSGQFYVFRALYLGNVKYTSGTTLNKGDEVIIHGKLTNYQGNTPETAQGKAYLYSLNGSTTGEGGEQPGDDPEPSAAGTYDAPWSVATAIENYKEGSAISSYVKGFIVGYVDGNAYAAGTKFEVPAKAETEILIAPTANETDPAKCMPVQLPKGAIRDGLELSANPGLLGKELLIYGSIEKYFGTAGIKSPSYAEVDGKTIGTKPVKRR